MPAYRSDKETEIRSAVVAIMNLVTEARAAIAKAKQ